MRGSLIAVRGGGQGEPPTELSLLGDPKLEGNLHRFLIAHMMNRYLLSLLAGLAHCLSREAFSRGQREVRRAKGLGAEPTYPTPSRLWGSTWPPTSQVPSTCLSFGFQICEGEGAVPHPAISSQSPCPGLSPHISYLRAFPSLSLGPHNCLQTRSPVLGRTGCSLCRQLLTSASGLRTPR